jgi:nucleoside-diphosphate-sugar epimerase
VAGLDRRPPRPGAEGVEQLRCDLLDAAALADAVGGFAPEAVLHLAARTDLDGRTVADYAANVEGVENLAAALRAAPSVRRVVCTSTQLVCRVGYAPAHDQDWCATTPYGQSKVRTEQIWRAADGAGTEWCLVRPTTIWGPGMNPHYLTFLRMVRDGRYFHVGRRPTMKSYGYVGNTVEQYLALIAAPAERIRGRVFYLSDYEPLSLQQWAETFRRELGGPRIRTLPRPVAVVGARVGDVVARVVPGFPLTSFRLGNILTSSQVDVGPIRELCPRLPFTVEAGAAETARWARAELDRAAA